MTDKIDRTNDAVFKAVFAKHPKITLSLANAFFELQGTEQIADIEFIDREIDGDLPDEKESRLDILGRTQAGVKVNIEMQVNPLLAMGERSLYYWSRNYVDLKKGEGYDKLKRTVAINILNYNIFDDKKYPDMHSCFGLFDMRTGCQLTKQLEIHFLELQKFHPMSIKEMNRMQKWAAYFSPSTPEDEMAAIVASDAEIRAAVEVEKMFTQDEVARRSYEKAEKFRRDQLAQLQYAQMQGFENGFEQGVDQEREKGINNMIAALRGLDVKEDMIVAKLKEGYDLSEADIKRYMTLH